MGRIIKKRDGFAFEAGQGGLEKVSLQEGSPTLWFSTMRGDSGNLTGRATLRALAHAILEAYPDTPKRGKR
jgi:hypothetical protein